MGQAASAPSTSTLLLLLLLFSSSFVVVTLPPSFETPPPAFAISPPSPSFSSPASGFETAATLLLPLLPSILIYKLFVSSIVLDYVENVVADSDGIRDSTIGGGGDAVLTIDSSGNFHRPLSSSPRSSTSTAFGCSLGVGISFSFLTPNHPLLFPRGARGRQTTTTAPTTSEAGRLKAACHSRRSTPRGTSALSISINASQLSAG
mmetsp:Transcript_14670/g.28040  ORF Transcript_14670/g.28040 Transcript_14670/m.28040 type:complete len:205 (+) Transcript_14670:707-1321(+)